MAKYKQTTIPEAYTTEWLPLKQSELKVKVFQEYKARYFGKSVINKHLGIKVGFEYEGMRKTSHSTPVYSKKACLVAVLDKIIRYAEYTNWGDRKPTDPDYVIGFLNFKAKVKIDEMPEQVHLVVRVRKSGMFTTSSFHYTLEVNKKENTLKKSRRLL